MLPDYQTHLTGIRVWIKNIISHTPCVQYLLPWLEARAPIPHFLMAWEPQLSSHVLQAFTPLATQSSALYEHTINFITELAHTNTFSCSDEVHRQKCSGN